jgi:hypothetical protein
MRRIEHTMLRLTALLLLASFCVAGISQFQGRAAGRTTPRGQGPVLLADGPTPRPPIRSTQSVLSLTS